jgi:hypothetical protein
MHEATLYSFLLRLCVPLWLKILQCFGKFQPWESKRRCPDFPKTSVFGKATLDLSEKAGFRPFFQEHFRKPTGFWEMLDLFGN